MKIKLFFLVVLMILPLSIIKAQDDIQIGSSGRSSAGGGFYDYSDPSAVNIKVQLWGYVGNPGFYIIPAGSSLNELISLAGGPREDALLNDIRVVKLREGTQPTLTKHNYNDLMWSDRIKNDVRYTRLDAGDIVIVPGEPRSFFREDVSFYLSLITALASVWALVFTITRN